VSFPHSRPAVNRKFLHKFSIDSISSFSSMKALKNGFYPVSTRLIITTITFY